MDRARKILKFTSFLGLLLLTWIIATYHVGTMPLPRRESLATTGPGGRFIPKARFGMHQLVLSGPPAARGLEAGKLTSHLIHRQEMELQALLNNLLPNRGARTLLGLMMMRWFHGIDDYLEPWMTEEMWGVSESTSHDLDFLADRFTRQVAYHGVHEVGQMSIDIGGADGGCTVLAVPAGGSWVIGRNFDFEGGRVFDDEKIVKWVFPEKGHAFVSVTWAGMVGVVTGVNEHGLFVAINAAGSSDFRRHGTPSTLVALKALQEARDAESAVKIIESATMFITDIFIVADRKSLLRVEKSPRRSYRIPLEGPSAVANHLIHSGWDGDRINEFRKRSLTSLARHERGEKLVATARDGSEMLAFLRDKTALGNRGAIDALITTHSVIYDAGRALLFVSQGPAVSGPFTGFDLERSFRDRTPVGSGQLPRDPAVSDERFALVRESARLVGVAEKKIKRGECGEAKVALDEVSALGEVPYGYFIALGRYHECAGDPARAREAWKTAAGMSPAYEKERKFLEEKLRR